MKLVVVALPREGELSVPCRGSSRITGGCARALSDCALVYSETRLLAAAARSPALPGFAIGQN